MSSPRLFLIAATFAAVLFTLAAAPAHLTAQQSAAPAPASSSSTPQQPYHVIDHWKVGGDGGCERDCDEGKMRTGHEGLRAEF